MSTTTLPVVSTVRSDARLTFGGILRSEWIKITSLRSTFWSLAIIVVLNLGISLLFASTMASAGLPAGPSAGFTLTTATVGIMFGQLVAAVLGVLAMSGEYSTGMIRSTLTAAPSRLPVLAAKAIVLFGLVTVVGLIALFGSWAATYPMFAALDLAVGLGEPGFALALIGGATYLGLIAVFALGLGTLLRSAAGGIAAALGVILILPVVLQLLGIAVEWVRDLVPYLLSSAGESMGSLATDAEASGTLEPWAGALVVLAWAAVSLLFAAIALRGRDA